jgi:hypothetical protein
MARLNFKVHELLPNGRAIISTRGLRRVILPRSGEVLRELVTPSQAAAFCKGFNACQGKDDEQAKPVAYSQLPARRRRVAAK